MTGAKVQMCKSGQLNEIAELLMSARADIVVNKNFIAAVDAINVALDEIAGLEPRSNTNKTANSNQLTANSQ